MSHSDHHNAGSVGVHVIVVSTTRTQATDQSGKLARDLLEDGGHRVLEVEIVTDKIRAIQQAVTRAAKNDEVGAIVLTGGTGLTLTDVTPEAVEPLFAKHLPGFGELFRSLSFLEIGPAAILSRAVAGVVGDTVVFAVPGSKGAVRLAIEQLINEELAHFIRMARRDGTAPVPTSSDIQAATEEPYVEAEVEELSDDDEPQLPPPEARWRLGSGTVEVSGEPMVSEAPATDADGETVPNRGWKRAVYDLELEIIRGEYPDMPEVIEKFAPVRNLLEQAGEYAQIKFPNKNRMTIYGFPDLQRPNSKVIAVGWGEPMAEIIALHRYPTQVGLCIEEERGLMPGRDTDIASICETVTGRAPPNTSGELFAVSHDTVWIQRGTRVYSWDGRREKDDGNAKQALASMVIDWHTR
ncbi:MAG: molybdenum cofactor biosynthesis protein B [Kiritimatiellia bacterium]|jgi:molybdenum cofactor biosynthesis protein B